MRTVAVVILTLALTGCVTLRDHRDAPWDPKPGQQLFDQIPNWEGAASKICGGHLPPEQRIKEGRSGRC